MAFIDDIAHNFRYRRQISLLILIEFINFQSPWNHQKTYGFWMISEGVELNYFAQNCLILSNGNLVTIFFMFGIEFWDEWVKPQHFLLKFELIIIE